MDRKIEMFLPPKLIAIVLNSFAILLMCVGSSDGQQADFNQRIAAMQEARARAHSPTAHVESTGMVSDYGVSPAPVARVAQAPQRVAAATQRMARGFVPHRLRMAQLGEEEFIDDGSPIMHSEIVGCSSCGGIEGGCSDCGGGCDSCGDAGGYFENGDQCCGRGGCPPGECWITGLGAVLYNGEYFAGATSFRGSLFATPGVSTGDLSNDNSHGFYGGFNLGLPLCRLSCGLFSGQVGIRSVQTNFNGNEFSTENRDQLFVTAGFYRRVDYGFQAGLVADILHEEWFTESDLVQIRGDLSWVYGNGTTLGFRYATNVQDDVNSGVFDGNAFTNLIQSTDDNYRFYYQRVAPGGGMGELSLGWTEGQTALGLDFDLPIAERVAMQSGFAYYLGDEGVPANAGQVGGNAEDAYNIYVGLVFRPRGRAYYRSYDRPMFSVADNGSMLISRQ
jgi:hypothetical protein